MNIDYDKDWLLTDFAIETLKDRYMLPQESSPQEALARAAEAFSDTPEMANKIYQYTSDQWLSLATPVLSNAPDRNMWAESDKWQDNFLSCMYDPKKIGLPISCFLNYVPDSRVGLADHYTENIFLASMGGGIGAYWGDLRSDGTSTSNGSCSTGSIPFLRIPDVQMLAFNQGRSRRGSYAAYMDVNHPEIMEFIGIRKPTGGDSNRKCLNLHHGVCITNNFINRVEECTKNPEANKGWDLIDPHTGEVIETVDITSVWEAILETRAATGEPYIINIDIINKYLNRAQKDKGMTVKQSNLCVHGDTSILTSEGNIQISSVEGKKIKVWNGEQFSDTTVYKTGEAKSLLTISFSSGQSLDCTPEHIFYVQNTYHGKAKKVAARDLTIGDKLEKMAKLPIGEVPNEVVEVTGITPKLGLHDTYCFTESIRGRGVFNGVLTGQCTEITLVTDNNRTAVCCLSSVNLEKYDEWVNDKDFIPTVIRYLDNVLEYFILNAPTQLHKAVYSAQKERSIGLGALGFHYWLQKNNIPFESAMAVSWNKKMFGHIKQQATLASIALGKERGIPDDLKDGTELRRNAHLLAVAPNASSSIILGTSPSIEPVKANAFTHKTLSGSFLVKNKYLEKVLEDKGINNDEVWKRIILNGGSVEGIEELSDYERDVFKTAKELDQYWVVQHAIDRQDYICQAQSVNLFFEPEANVKYVHGVHLKAMKNLKSLYYLRSEALKRAESISSKVERVVLEDKECFGCEG